MGTLRRAETTSCVGVVWGGPTLSELCRWQVKVARLGDQMPLNNPLSFVYGNGTLGFLLGFG